MMSEPEVVSTVGNMLWSPVQRMQRPFRRGHGQKLEGPKAVVNLHWLYAITFFLGAIY